MSFQQAVAPAKQSASHAADGDRDDDGDGDDGIVNEDEQMIFSEGDVGDGSGPISSQRKLELCAEIFDVRKDINSVVASLVPELAAQLPRDGGVGIGGEHSTKKGAVRGGSGAPCRPSPPPPKVSQNKTRGGAPPSRMGSARPASSSTRGVKPNMRSGRVVNVTQPPLRSVEGCRADVVASEVREWRAQAAVEATSKFQSIFTWVDCALTELEARAKHAVPDGELPGAPSHYEAHTTFTILRLLLEAICPHQAVRTRLLSAVASLIFLPHGSTVDNIGEMERSRAFADLTASNDVLDDDEEEDDEKEGSKATASSSARPTVVTYVLPMEHETTAKGATASDALHTVTQPSATHNNTSAPNSNAGSSNHNSARPNNPVDAGAGGAGGGVETEPTRHSWALLLQRQNDRIGVLVNRLKSGNSAIIALRGLLRSVFQREDQRRLRVAFSGWRGYSAAANHRRGRSEGFLAVRSVLNVKGLYFRTWARTVAASRRIRLLKAKEDAVQNAKTVNRQLKEAVQAGREEMTREVERLKVMLADERGSRERQYTNFASEIETMTEDMHLLRFYLQLTAYHKALWRSLWLTQHRENRLPAVVPESVGEEGAKLRDGMKALVASMRAGGDSVVTNTQGSTVRSLTEDDVSVPTTTSEPQTPTHPSVGVSLTAPPAGGAAAATNNVGRCRVFVRGRIESMLIAWVNEMLVALNVQRFLIAVRDDLSDGIIFAALCFALDKSKRDQERFVEEHARRLPPAAIGKKLLGTIKAASRRSASAPFSLPLIQLCPTLHEHMDEKSVLMLHSVDDPWYHWVLCTLFLDYCYQQVFVEPVDPSSLALMPPTPPSASKSSAGRLKPQASNASHAVSVVNAAAANPLKSLYKDSLHFLVAGDNRSEFYAHEVVDDAAEYAFSSFMRPGAGSGVDGGPSFSSFGGTASGGNASRDQFAPSLTNRGVTPSFSMSNNAKSSAAGAGGRSHRTAPQFLPVGGFAQTPSSTQVASATTSPVQSNLPIRRKGGQPSSTPATHATHTTAATRSLIPKAPASSHGRHTTNATSPQETTMPSVVRVSPSKDDGESPNGGAESANVSLFDAPHTNNTSSAADGGQQQSWSHTGGGGTGGGVGAAFMLDPLELANRKSPLSTIETQKTLVALRRRTERCGVDEALHSLLGSSDNRGDDEDDLGSTSSGSPQGSPTRMHDNASADSFGISPGAGNGGQPAAASFLEFDAAAQKPSPPLPVSRYEEQVVSLHPFDPDIEYDAVACGTLAFEASRRKVAWCDLSRLLITAVGSYGVLERSGSSVHGLSSSTQPPPKNNRSIHPQQPHASNSLGGAGRPLTTPVSGSASARESASSAVAFAPHPYGAASHTTPQELSIGSISPQSRSVA